MKFHMITVMAALLMIGTANAQVTVHPGIKGGLNVTSLYNGSGPNYDWKPSFHAGLLAHIHLSDHFGIQPEAVFSRQGAQFDNAGTNAKLTLDYINVPVLFQYMFARGFRLQAGPQIGFMTGSALRNKDFYYSNSGAYRTVDIAGAVGVSYVFNPGFGLDARYVHGFTNIIDIGSGNVMNGGFQVGGFYILGHSTKER